MNPAMNTSPANLRVPAKMTVNTPAVQFSAGFGGGGDKIVFDNAVGTAFTQKGQIRRDEQRVLRKQEALTFAQELYVSADYQEKLNKTMDAVVVEGCEVITEITGKDILEFILETLKELKGSGRNFDPIVFEREFAFTDTALEHIHIVLAELEALAFIEKRGRQYAQPNPNDPNTNLDEYYTGLVAINALFPESEAMIEEQATAEQQQTSMIKKLLTKVGIGRNDDAVEEVTAEPQEVEPQVLTAKEKLNQDFVIRNKAGDAEARQITARKFTSELEQKTQLLEAFGGQDQLAEVLQLMKEGYPYAYNWVLPTLCPDVTAEKGGYSNDEKASLIAGLDLLVQEGLAKKEFNGNRYWLTPFGESCVDLIKESARRKELITGLGA